MGDPSRGILGMAVFPQLLFIAKEVILVQHQSILAVGPTSPMPGCVCHAMTSCSQQNRDHHKDRSSPRRIFGTNTFPRLHFVAKRSDFGPAPQSILPAAPTSPLPGNASHQLQPANRAFPGSSHIPGAGSPPSLPTSSPPPAPAASAASCSPLH